MSNLADEEARGHWLDERPESETPDQPDDERLQSSGPIPPCTCPAFCLLCPPF